MKILEGTITNKTNVHCKIFQKRIIKLRKLIQKREIAIIMNYLLSLPSSPNPGIMILRLHDWKDSEIYHKYQNLFIWLCLSIYRHKNLTTDITEVHLQLIPVTWTLSEMESMKS